MAHWDSAQGQAKTAKITQKKPYLWCSPQKTSNPKWKQCFFDFDSKTCWIRWGFEQLSSGWRFMAKKGGANMLARAVVKGLNVSATLQCWLSDKALFYSNHIMWDISTVTTLRIQHVLWRPPFYHRPVSTMFLISLLPVRPYQQVASLFSQRLLGN